MDAKCKNTKADKLVSQCRNTRGLEGKESQTAIKETEGFSHEKYEFCWFDQLDVESYDVASPKTSTAHELVGDGNGDACIV